MKFGVLVFGVLGLISLFLPVEGMTLFSAFKEEPLDLVIALAGFGVPIAVGVMGMSRPFRAPLAAAALGAFALVFVKWKMWQGVQHLGSAPLALKLFLIAPIGGILISLAALMKPED